jgi:hypothetical protein
MPSAMTPSAMTLPGRAALIPGIEFDEVDMELTVPVLVDSTVAVVALFGEAEEAAELLPVLNRRINKSSYSRWTNLPRSCSGSPCHGTASHKEKDEESLFDRKTHTWDCLRGVEVHLRTGLGQVVLFLYLLRAVLGQTAT